LEQNQFPYIPDPDDYICRDIYYWW